MENLMETQTLVTPIQVLDNILVINLDITLWSARRKLTAEDFGGIELPPEDLASLGSKKICDPARLNVFLKLKARAVTLLNKVGVRFLSGWAIPEDKASEVIQGLCDIRDNFFVEKEDFLSGYDAAIDDWIARHPSWAGIIKGSTVSREYVDSRMNFVWQMFRVMPAAQLSNDTTELESGLGEEVGNLGTTLFQEISRDAADIWKKVFEGRTEVTHKALSPIKTMRDKLAGLSFIDPHVLPAVQLIDTALSKMPKKGNIMGAPLLTLQGLICMFKDTESLLAQSQAIMTDSSAENTLMNWNIDQLAPISELAEENAGVPPSQSNFHDNSDPAALADQPSIPVSHLDSMGLW